MQQVLDHILVPVDGSEASLRAVDFAASLAQACLATLELMTVIEMPELEGGQALSDQEFAQISAAVEEEILATALARIPADGPPTRTRVVRGAVIDSLLAEAGRPEISLVVMGRTGKGAFKGVVEGSVTGRVSACCSVPVTVVG